MSKGKRRPAMVDSEGDATPEQLRLWDALQLDLARHLEVWRVRHGLTFVETADTVEWVLMLGDEQLEAAMRGDDPFADEGEHVKAMVEADLESIAERTQEVLEDETFSPEKATTLLDAVLVNVADQAGRLEVQLEELAAEPETLSEELERLAREPDALLVGRVAASKKKRESGK